MSLHTVDWTDKEGIKRRVILPEGETFPDEGIPVSLDVDTLFQQATVTFRRNLTDELWSRGLILPEDFLKPGSAELIRSALLGAVRRDTMDIMSLAKERLGNA